MTPISQHMGLGIGTPLVRFLKSLGGLLILWIETSNSDYPCHSHSREIIYIQGLNLKYSEPAISYPDFYIDIHLHLNVSSVCRACGAHDIF